MIPFKYEITDEEVQVKFGSWVLRRIKLYDIKGVDQKYTIWNEHWCIVWPLKFVVLRRKTGLVRNFVINPLNPEGFMKDLKAKIFVGTV